MRGAIVGADSPHLHFAARRDISFRTVDLRAHLDTLCLRSAAGLADLHALSFDEILAYLADLGERLEFGRNAYLQEALALGSLTGGMSSRVMRTQLESLSALFRKDSVRAIVEEALGVPFLEGWVDRGAPGHATAVRVRAFGARSVHVIAGNAPQIAAATVIRNAITRSDAIVKLPSNDLLTMVAIARTMIDMSPRHPITRHLSCAYWKGGDEAVEQHLYHPRHVEKLVAWGGAQTIRHVAKYLRPGMELISFDPKSSCAILGPECFASEPRIRSVARRLALDVGEFNQQACFNVRVVFIVGDISRSSILTLGQLMLRYMRALPTEMSDNHTVGAQWLEDELDAIRMTREDQVVIGEGPGHGAVIYSAEPVEYAERLVGRIANFVPVATVSDAVARLGAQTQTVAVFPEALQTSLRMEVALQGVQRIVSLGGVARLRRGSAPQDGFEPLRRLVRWVVEEPPLQPSPDDAPEPQGCSARLA